MKSLKLIGLALGASLALSTTALAQDISIAVAGPMTGGESAFGRQMKNGAEQAVADINAAGGVIGKKLALQVGDDACDPKQARSVAEKFASSKIPFVAGHFCGRIPWMALAFGISRILSAFITSQRTRATRVLALSFMKA